MCFAPQRGALFQHLNFQKLSGPGVFCTFLFGNECASRHNGVHFFDISSAKSGPHPKRFWHFDLEICFAPQRRALFRHLNCQKWSGPGVFCTFWLGNVLRATTACTFSTSQFPKVVRTWCVLHILTWKCASRHNGVQFFISMALLLTLGQFHSCPCLVLEGIRITNQLAPNLLLLRATFGGVTQLDQTQSTPQLGAKNLNASPGRFGSRNLMLWQYDDGAEPWCLKWPQWIRTNEALTMTRILTWPTLPTLELLNHVESTYQMHGTSKRTLGSLGMLQSADCNFYSCDPWEHHPWKTQECWGDHSWISAFSGAALTSFLSSTHNSVAYGGGLFSRPKHVREVRWKRLWTGRMRKTLCLAALWFDQLSLRWGVLWKDVESKFSSDQPHTFSPWMIFNMFFRC